MKVTLASCGSPTRRSRTGPQIDFSGIEKGKRRKRKGVEGREREQRRGKEKGGKGKGKIKNKGEGRKEGILIYIPIYSLKFQFTTIRL